MTRPHRILPIPDPGPQSILVTIIDASAASPSSIQRIPLSLSSPTPPLLYAGHSGLGRTDETGHWLREYSLWLVLVVVSGETIELRCRW